jgi:hypothetical protein
MMIMSIGWDYVSELQPPLGPRCYMSSDIDSGKLLIRPLELSGNHTSSHLVAKQEKLAKDMINPA